jgi:hypothetical protein
LQTEVERLVYARNVESMAIIPNAQFGEAISAISKLHLDQRGT